LATLELAPLIGIADTAFTIIEPLFVEIVVALIFFTIAAASESVKNQLH
jgi:hypothetical protein